MVLLAQTFSADDWIHVGGQMISATVFSTRRKSQAEKRSAEGAAFSRHGRKAVDHSDGLRSRPEGPTFFCRKMPLNAAPSALNYSYFALSTASWPWLLNDGPSDLSFSLIQHAPKPLCRSSCARVPDYVWASVTVSCTASINGALGEVSESSRSRLAGSLILADRRTDSKI